MSSTIRAKVKHGILEPLEKVDLPEGEEVVITILGSPSTPDFDAFRRSAGGWKGTLNVESLIRNIYADRLVSTRPEPRL
jgi:predicted DNA-binding antitoxin AbrB/MazE fold protein